MCSKYDEFIKKHLTKKKSAQDGEKLKNRAACVILKEVAQVRFRTFKS